MSGSSNSTTLSPAETALPRMPPSIERALGLLRVVEVAALQRLAGAAWFFGTM